MSKTYKKDYTGSKKFDRSCRNHGDCPACVSKRMHKHRKQIESANQQIEEFKHGFKETIRED